MAGYAGREVESFPGLALLDVPWILMSHLRLSAHWPGVNGQFPNVRRAEDRADSVELHGLLAAGRGDDAAGSSTSFSFRVSSAAFLRHGRIVLSKRWR